MTRRSELLELHVQDLGVIEELSLLLGPGMTALTGETGAGKTLVVTAIDLLLGGRADPVLVRPGAPEARVEGRFCVPVAGPASGTSPAPHDAVETVLARVVPSEGRSRAYLDGRLATLGALAEVGTTLVDLHGQHAHQSLLSAAAQRAALDAAAGVDLTPLRTARDDVARIDAALARLGGDARSRARELDLLTFQVDEIDAARLDDPDEDAVLEAEETELADAVAHREAGARAAAALADDGAALDGLGAALAALGHRSPFSAAAARLRVLQAELLDVASELRDRAEAIAEDPTRLDAVRARRQALRELRRKYGDTLAEVMAEGERLRARRAELVSHDDQVARLERERDAALARVAAAAAVVGGRRRAAAPALAAAVQARLADLAMPRARLAVHVGADDPGDEVTFLLAANPGSPLLPLAKVASGGELARTMLALRLVLGDAGGAPAGGGPPPTLVFDEVDAGIGGEAALAVGRSLAALGASHQVLVVTHLAQVAAFADAQVVVRKHDLDGVARTTVTRVDGAERVAELSRMLSGMSGSEAARRHAEELLAEAARRRDGAAPTAAAPTAAAPTAAAPTAAAPTAPEPTARARARRARPQGG